MFAERVERWIQDRPSKPRRLWRAVKGYAYNNFPKRWRFSGLLHWSAKTGMASSAPAVAWIYGSISGVMATGVGVAVFAGHSLVSFLDRISQQRSNRPGENEGDIIIRFGDLLTAHKVELSVGENERADAIRACLGILEIFSRQITGATRDEVSVSLLLYTGNSRTKMKVRSRNPGNLRPVNREVDAERLLGHAACINGALPRVVHDVREFGKAVVSSPTQSNMEYRSILFCPIVLSIGDEKTVPGFVSIDCKRPYAFYGNKSNVIVVTCEPVLNHIAELVREAKNGRATQRPRRQ